MSTALCDRLSAALGKVKVVDTHEHLAHPDFWLKRKLDFGWLLMHYASCDVVSAGLPALDMGRIQGQELSEDEKWKLFAPYWQRARNTTYCRGVLRAIRDVYGIDDLSRDTYRAVGEAMRKAQKPDFFRKTLRSAGVEVCLWNWINFETHSDIGFREDYDREMLVQDYVDPFVFADPPLWRQKGHRLANLADYEELIAGEIARRAPVASACKIGHAYARTLRFDEVSRSDAWPIFDKLLASGKNATELYAAGAFHWTAEGKALMDYLCHFVIARCAENKLPVKFHTGLQEGYGNLIAHSNPTLLTNLFLKFPGTRFDLYHVGYPFFHEMGVLAKNFQNVAIDFCWTWIMSPTTVRAALHEYLEMVPYTKLHGFGGDYIMVEPVVGHLAFARENIAQVLSEKVEQGWFSEDEALRVGRALLRDNAMEFFRIEEKRAAARKEGIKSTARSARK